MSQIHFGEVCKMVFYICIESVGSWHITYVLVYYQMELTLILSGACEIRKLKFKHNACELKMSASTLRSFKRLEKRDNCFSLSYNTQCKIHYQ